MTPAPRKPALSPQSQLFSAQMDAAAHKSDRRVSADPWITAYTDGGSRGNPGPAGYGVLLHGEDGTTVAELSEFLGIHSNNVAEYSALLGALEYALAHGHRHLRVISDSELMVKQIRGQYSVKSPDLRPLYEEARRRISRLADFEIQHVLRGKNKKADQLANDAMDRGMKGGMRRASEGSSRTPATSGQAPAASFPHSITSPSAPASRPEPSTTAAKAKQPSAATTPTPVQPDYASIPISRPVSRSTDSPSPMQPSPTHSLSPTQSGPIRGIVRHGAIQLPEGTLPDGTVVIIMTEEALRNPK